MARSRRVITLDEKIEEKEAQLAKAKAKYDELADQLKLLIDKRNKQKLDELMKAVEGSDKTLDEIIAYVRTRKIFRIYI